MKQKQNVPMANTKKNTTMLIGAALAATLLCFAVSALCFGVRYQLNDDAIISNIAAGAYGVQTHRLVYVNMLFGWFLKPFYAIAGTINWFVIWLLAGAVACFTVLGTLVLKKLGLALGGGVFGIFLLLVGVDFFHIFHYVKYAALFTATGLLLVALNLGKWNKPTFLGMGLALWGSMLRFQQAVAVAGLAAAVLISFFIRLPAAQKKKALCAAAVLLALVLGAKGADYASYALNPEWAAYTRFNALRTRISDFGLQFATPEDLAALGYSVTDYEMLDTWNFYDPAVFDEAALQQLVNTLPHNSISSALGQTVKAAVGLLYGRPVYILFGAVLLGWVFVSGKKNRLAFLGTLAMLGAQLFYLHWQGRYPDTVQFCLALTAMLFCAASYSDVKKDNRYGLLCCALLLLCSIPGFIGFNDATTLYWETRPARAAEFEAAVGQEDVLYLADVQLVDAANGYNVWRPRPKGYFNNIVFTGSWLMQSPFQQQALHNFGVNNLYQDSIGRQDVVYLETVYRELKEDYLKQHYGPNVQLVRVQDGNIVSGYIAIKPE